MSIKTKELSLHPIQFSLSKDEIIYFTVSVYSPNTISFLNVPCYTC